MRIFRFSFLISFVCVSGCASPSIQRHSEKPRTVPVPGAGVFRWDETDGWIQPDRGLWGTSGLVRTESFRAFQAGAYADALAGFSALESRHSTSAKVAADSRAAKKGKDLNFYIGECYFHLGHYDEALKHYQLVYRRDFPEQKLLDQALQRVFAIGMAYLNKEVVCEFLGISYACPEHGIEILAGPQDGLITEYPMVSFADETLIAIAKYYYEQKEYPEAVPLYDQVAADLDSPWADLAEFQAAMAKYKEVRGVDYDPSIIRNAERRFSRYFDNHPRGDHVAEAREKLAEISEMEGDKNLRIAKFYLRESQPVACEHYLKLVRSQYPNSKAAAEARGIQRQLDGLKEGK